MSKKKSLPAHISYDSMTEALEAYAINHRICLEHKEKGTKIPKEMEPFAGSFRDYVYPPKKSFFGKKKETTQIVDLSGIEPPERTNLTYADLRGVTFKDAKMPFTNFRGAILTGVDLSNTNLHGAIFDNANLQNANLTTANLKGTTLKDSNMEDVDLTKAHLERTRLDNADLRNARLWNTVLDRTVLNEANLTGASIDNATCESCCLCLNLKGDPGNALPNAIRTNQQLAQALLDDKALDGWYQEFNVRGKVSPDMQAQLDKHYAPQEAVWVSRTEEGSKAEEKSNGRF